MTTVARRRYAKRLQPSERREQVLDAALRLIVDVGSFHVTMEAVAESAGVTKPVVYDYFANRNELLRALIDREFERAAGIIAEIIPDLRALGEVDPNELLVDRTQAYLEAVQKHPDTFALILLPAAGAPPELRTRIQRGREEARQGLKYMVGAVASAESLRDIDLDVFTHVVQVIAERIAELVITQPDEYPPERSAEFVRALLAPLSPQ